MSKALNSLCFWNIMVEMVQGGVLMSIFDSVQKWNTDRKQIKELRNRIARDENLSPREVAYFIEKTKETPEEYKLKYDELQARRAEMERVAELKAREERYSIGGLVFRGDKDGRYYFSSAFDEHAPKYVLTNYQWSGPIYNAVSTTHTTGKDTTQGRTGSAILGGIVGGAINPAGAVVGATAGANRKKNTKVDRTTVTQIEQKEIDSDCILEFVNVGTGEKVFKTLKCNSKIIQEVIGLRFTQL